VQVSRLQARSKLRGVRSLRTVDVIRTERLNAGPMRVRYRLRGKMART